MTPTQPTPHQRTSIDRTEYDMMASWWLDLVRVLVVTPGERRQHYREDDLCPADGWD